MITFETEGELEEFVKNVIKDNLSVEVERYQPDWRHEGYCVEISLYLNGELISEASYDE